MAGVCQPEKAKEGDVPPLLRLPLWFKECPYCSTNPVQTTNEPETFICVLLCVSRVSRRTDTPRCDENTAVLIERCGLYGVEPAGLILSVVGTKRFPAKHALVSEA